MHNSPVVEATFIANSPASDINQLAVALNKIQDLEAKLLEKQKENRQNLAKKLIKARQRLFNKIKLQASDRENSILHNKLLELSELCNTISKNCYHDALKTIKAVCINVFSQSSDAYDFLLQSSLDKAFKEMDPSKIIQLQVPASMLTKYRDSKFESGLSKDNRALIHCKAGTLIIDPILEFQSGFESLHDKLEAIYRKDNDPAK